MSVPQTILFVSLRDMVVSTQDGYAIRFKAQHPTPVPNFKRVIQAVQAAGCVPYDEITSGEKIKIKTVEQGRDEESSEREVALVAAMHAIIDRDNPVDFNRAGFPQTRSLETLSGLEKVTNVERDRVWKKFQTMRNGQ